MESELNTWDVGSDALARVHREANNGKFSGYFTGFLEGVRASQRIELGEVEPLVVVCAQMLDAMGDEDAYDILEDFKADVLDFQQLEDIVVFRSKNLKQNCQKTEINRFMGYCSGIACDDLITLEEAQGVLNMAAASPSVLEDPISRTIVVCCADSVDDGVIDPGESQEICRAITRLVGDCYADTGISSLGYVPVFEEATLSSIDDFENSLLVLTGNFETKPRRILEDYLAACGARAKSSPCKKTNFVIIANESSRDWKYTHKGTKIEKAIKLREASGKPEFISETQLMKLLASANI